MRVNGNQIREARRRAQFRKGILDKQFPTSIYIFKGESKSSPEEVAKEFKQADENLAILETLQQYFNQQVRVDVGGRKMPLALVVKMVSGAGRLEKMWRDAAGGGKQDRYGYNDRNVRNKDEVRAELQVTVEDSMKKADKAARWSSNLREALATGNATTIEVSEKEIGFDIPKGLLD